MGVNGLAEPESFDKDGLCWKVGLIGPGVSAGDAVGVTIPEASAVRDKASNVGFFGSPAAAAAPLRSTVDCFPCRRFFGFVSSKSVPRALNNGFCLSTLFSSEAAMTA